MAELIGTATTEKNGLMTSIDYLRLMQMFTFSQGAVYKIAKLTGNYRGIWIIGTECTTSEQIHATIIKCEGEEFKCNAPTYMTIKWDKSYNIYISVPIGKSVSAVIYSSYMLKITSVSDFPTDAVDIERSE